MHKRLAVLDRNSIAASLTLVTCLACSSSATPPDPGTGQGGVSSNGGASTGGAASTSTKSTGGWNASGGTPAIGGSVATGGKTAQGGANPSGGTATGGVLGTGGNTTQGGTASGGALPTGGSSNTGGSKPGSGGSAAGGVNAGGKSSTGGSSGQSTGGSSNAVGGAATGGAGSGAQCPSTATAKAGESTVSVTVGTVKRSFLLHVPPKYDGKTLMPAIIDFHPLGGTGSSQKTLSGWGTKADSVGIIMVWPDGIGNSWNVGRCCPPAYDNSNATGKPVDDVGFAREIVKYLQTYTCADTKRIFATGCSNGGGMSYKVACEAADVIAAVAPVDFDCVVGPTNNPSCGGCAPKSPSGAITEIQFRATSDSAVAYNGGAAPIPQGMNFPGAKQNLADWFSIDKCTGTAQTLSSNTSCQIYSTCAGGTQVGLCTQQGGSHCGNYSALHIVDTAWSVFQSASLP